MKNTKNVLKIDHPWIQHMRKIVSNTSYRNFVKSTVITSKTILNDLSDKNLIRQLAQVNGVLRNSELDKKSRFILEDPSIINFVTKSSSNEGILAEVAIPQIARFENLSFIEKSIITPKIQDPSNFGLLVRCSRALNAKHLVTSIEGSVDPFNFKSVAASMGQVFAPNFLGKAHRYCFRDVKTVCLISELKDKIPKEYSIVKDIGYLSIFGKPNSTFKDFSNANLIMGNEVNGFEDIDNFNNLPNNYLFVTINTKNKMSMNVATSLSTIISTIWSIK